MYVGMWLEGKSCTIELSPMWQKLRLEAKPTYFDKHTVVHLTGRELPRYIELLRGLVQMRPGNLHPCDTLSHVDCQS